MSSTFLQMSASVLPISSSATPAPWRSLCVTRTSSLAEAPRPCVLRGLIDEFHVRPAPHDLAVSHPEDGHTRPRHWGAIQLGPPPSPFHPGGVLVREQPQRLHAEVGNLAERLRPFAPDGRVPTQTVRGMHGVFAAVVRTEARHERIQVAVIHCAAQPLDELRRIGPFHTSSSTPYSRFSRNRQHPRAVSRARPDLAHASVVA